MIAFLQGVLTEKFSDRVELDVNGMGYEVFVSQKTLQSLPAAGKNVLLKTYLHVREDLLQLFGFLKESEKQAFLLALSVSGIGPRAAMNILSAFAPEAFAARDALWAAADPRFYELNDLLQYLGCFAFRSPVPAYKHTAAQFLKLRGRIKSDLPHPRAQRRPESDVEILRHISERLDLLVANSR